MKYEKPQIIDLNDPLLIGYGGYTEPCFGGSSPIECGTGSIPEVNTTCADGSNPNRQY